MTNAHAAEQDAVESQGPWHGGNMDFLNVLAVHRPSESDINRYAKAKQRHKSKRGVAAASFSPGAVLQCNVQGALHSLRVVAQLAV